VVLVAEAVFGGKYLGFVIKAVLGTFLCNHIIELMYGCVSHAIDSSVKVWRHRWVLDAKENVMVEFEAQGLMIAG